jgi:hypothetical protein
VKLVARVLELTCSEPPGAATHWTGRILDGAVMAKTMGISQRICDGKRGRSQLSGDGLEHYPIRLDQIVL